MERQNGRSSQPPPLRQALAFKHLQSGFRDRPLVADLDDCLAARRVPSRLSCLSTEVLATPLALDRSERDAPGLSRSASRILVRLSAAPCSRRSNSPVGAAVSTGIGTRRPLTSTKVIIIPVGLCYGLSRTRRRIHRDDRRIGYFAYGALRLQRLRTSFRAHLLTPLACRAAAASIAADHASRPSRMASSRFDRS